MMPCGACMEYMMQLSKENSLDGIEYFHPSANEDKMNILVEYAKNNNLYISGGSDYHGRKKPDIEVGIGINISKEYIEKWI